MTSLPIARPTAMCVDPVRCVRCELCEAILPGVLGDPERVAVTPAALEAMAVCPVGAIVWCDDASPSMGA